MQIGSRVICLRLPEYGAGTVVDITKTGLLRVLFDDDYMDDFHAQELDLVAKQPTLKLGTAA